jgi:type II secretory pathway pseudopilin PulG
MSLNRKPVMHGARNEAGFSLIELMVAIVAGMVLVGAALVLVVATLTANSENLAVTRLTQELRAVSQVVAREVRRAGGIPDSLRTIGSKAASPREAVEAILLAPGLEIVGADGDCVRFVYQTFDGAGTIASRMATISLIDGQVSMGVSDDPTAPVECDDVDTPLSSPLVLISALNFIPIPSDTAMQGIAMYLQGELRSAPVGVAGVTRSYTESIYIPALIASE